jgi:hypothetical protein
VTNNILIEATPYNPATSSFVTVRMTLMGADDRGTQLNGYQWMPCVNGTPITTRRFASDGVAQAFEGNGGEVGFVCAPQFGNQDWATLQWDGATFAMFVAPIGAPWTEYRQVLSGTTSAIKREGAQCSINLSGSEATLNRNLLTASYAGTGNAEGPSELKGTLKPFAAGDCLNIEPILIDPVRFIYQFHGYGAAQDVTAVYEQALTLGPASTTASTYNSLRDATLQPGEWIKAPAIGCFRLGAEPTGKITVDIKGGKDGSTYPASIATIVPLLIKAAGVPAAKIKTSSFAAFSGVAWSYYTKAQVQIGDVARDALQQAGGYLMADGLGNWQVGNYYATSTATALREDRSALPLVRSIVQNEAAPPVYRVRVGYNRCWAVHSADEISPALSEAQDDIIAAKEAADAAKAAADAAQADADQALQQIDNIGADGILDRAEKAIIVREFQQVTAERAGIESRATGAGITTLLTAYTSAYNTLSSYLSGLSPAYTDTTQNTSITRSTWNSRWNGYYTARQALLNEIARLAADMVGSLPASTVANAVTNFNTRNDRNASPVTAPTLLTDGTAITSTANTDGSADIRFNWNWAGSNDDIDGFRVIVRSSTSSSAYTLGGAVGEEQAFELPADRRAFGLYGTAADRFYTFYVQAYRVVDPDVASGGLIVSTAVKSTRSGANPYQPSATVNFIGKVGGVDAAALVAQAAAAKPIDTTAPSQVTGLTVTSTAAFDAVGGQIITLNIGWTASTAADLAGYSLEIAQGASSTTFIPVGNVGKSASTYAYSAGILANTVYRVRVAAYDDSANLGNWSTIVNVTTARDTAAPAAPTGMTAEAQALDAIQINWTNPSASDLDRIEIYEHTANSSSAATKIMTVNGSAGQIGGYRRSGLPASALRYYWTKAVDTSGNASGFSGVVSATTSKGVNLDDLDPTLGLTIPQEVSALPTVASWTGSKLIRNTGDGALYVLESGAWKKAIDMASISGQVLEAQIATGAVTSVKIGTNEVKTTNIAPLAVTAAEMANLTISAGKLANSSVNSDKLTTNAVIEAKIATGAVTVNKIGDGAITTAKLFDGAVNSDKLAGGSVLEDKIGLEAVTAAKIGPSAVTADKVAANSITASKLVVADVSNYVQDPTFSDEAYWALTRGTFSTDSAAINAMAVPKAFKTDVGNGTTSQADSRIATQASQRYSIEGGASYRVNGTWYVTAGFTGLIQIVLYWYKADGSGASTSSQTLTLADYRSTAAAAAANGTGNLLVQAPTNAVFAKFDYKIVWATGINNAGYGYVAYPILNRAASGELIVDGAITATKIATNSIDATKVAAGSITASKLLIGDTSNMFGDAAMVDAAFYAGDYAITATGNPIASVNRMRTTNQTGASMITTGFAATEPGKDYYFSTHAYIETGASTATVAIDWFTQATGGALISTDIVGTSTVTNGGAPRVSGIFKAPANGRAVRFTWSKAASASASQGSFGEPIIRRATTGELIVDGAITATKLSVNSVDASKIAAGSIIASKMAIGDTSNMVPDPNMSDLACWRGNTVTTGLAVGTYTSTNFLAAASSTDRLEFGSTPIQIEAGKDYFVSAGVRNSGNSIPTLFLINWYSDSAAAVYISNSLVGTNSTGSFATLLSTIVTAPANARTATMQFIKETSATASGLQAVSPIFRRASSGELIVDGSIVASKIAVGAVSANKMSVVAGGNIEDNRLPTGLYVGTTGDTIGTVQTQASSAFDGTAGYRVTGVPTNTPTPSSASITANSNGTRNITLNWAAYTQGTRKADFLMIFWKKAATAPGLNDATVSVNVNTSAASYYIFEGIDPTSVMSFGIAAARRTENGIEIGAIQTIAGWTNLATATPNFTGNINGTSAATIRANALNPASVINAAATTIDPGKILITGTTTLADWRYGNTTTIDGGFIATNTITANAIAANTITASRLAIGDTANMVDNGWSTGNLDGWVTQNVTNFSQDNTAGAAAGWRIQSIGRDQAVSAAVSVTPGESYYMQAWCVNRHAGRANIYAFGTADLTLAGTVTITSVGFTDAKNGWTKVSGIYTVPTGVTALRMCLQSERTAGSGDPTFWSKPVMTRAMTGELIVDGAITASKIKAGEIISDHITVGTLAGDRIAGRTIGADRLVAGSISVNEMGANSISANQLQTNAVTAAKIKAGEITGDKINSATSLPATLTISGTGFSLGTINTALGNTGQLVTYNGDFIAWAGARPDGFNAWGNSGNTTKVTGERGGKSVRITATANGQNGMVQTGDNGTNAGNYALYAGRWIVIEADITLNSGNLQGAGILVRAQGGADTYLSFANDPEVWGGVAGNGSAGQTYSFRKLVATTSGSSTRPEMYLMNHYGGIGSMATANDITWHHAGWRYASDGEYNPAKQVNAASTQIDPGKILISGSTSLASWRNGGDNTKIEGGSIAANTITANKLTLGNRNIGFIGFNFEWNPTLNRVEWSNGYIYWQDDNNNLVATLVAAGNTGSAVAHQFIYWTKGASTFSITQNQGLMISDNTIQVAAWWGGTQLNVNYGGTIMHGDRITTGTIQANRLSVGQLSAITADMGTVYAGMIRNNAGSTQFDVTNGRIIFNNGSVMKVSGSGFGTNNQFIEWFGPALANINQCSESNATSYLRNDGSAYFGGALLAGTLRNTNATSVLTNNASTTIGPFGSNGNQIVVNASWSWSSVNRADYPANATGRNNYNSAISTLQSQGYTIVDDGGGSGHTGYKSDNKDGSQFALTLVKNGGQAASEGGCTGYIGLYGVRPEPADGQPGFIEYTYTYSKSLTYTDPERSTAQRTFTASITRNFTPSGTANQRVGVNTVE